MGEGRAGEHGISLTEDERRRQRGGDDRAAVGQLRGWVAADAVGHEYGGATGYASGRSTWPVVILIG
jgi:hypothetical protein